MVVSGLATLDGTLDVHLINGFAPTNGETFQVLNYDPHSGQFASVVLEDFPDGITLGSSYLASHMVLTATVVPILNSIAVTPANPGVAKGRFEQFTATATYSDGSTSDITNSVAWTSSSGTVATIDATGLASALNIGASIITAALGPVRGATTLTVTAATLTSIALTPVNPSIVAGTTQQFTATGTYTDGSTVAITSSVTWNSSNIVVATISASGLASGVNTGSSTITAVLGSVSSSTTLTVTPAVPSDVTAVSVSWGTVGSASVQTAPDGIRLLPAGRNTDLPWQGVNRINITLSQAASLTSGDVVVTSAAGVNYGPVTLSGSGTDYVITLATPINAADRVTFSIGSSTVATFTRRLDVLPGDVNDDGAVTMQDALVVHCNQYLGFAPVPIPVVFLDVNGDGVVDARDYNTARSLIGTKLPHV